MFSDLPVTQQLEVLFGAGTCALLETTARGLLLVRRFGQPGLEAVVVAFDYTRHHGSIGTAEAAQIREAVGFARHAAQPLVFLVNSSGMRVTEGMQTVAALRGLLRTLLDAVLGGQRMLALVTHHAFGGASMIASLCELRLVHAGSLIGMSGPKLITRAAGSEVLDAANPEAVRALLGGQARAAVSGLTRLCENSARAFQEAVFAWLGARPPSYDAETLVKERLLMLRSRLGARVLPKPAESDAASLDPALAALFRTFVTGDLAIRRGPACVLAMGTAPGSALVFSVTGGAPCTAAAAQAFSHCVMRLSAESPSAKIVILVDSPNHSADPADEQVVLSEYLVGLALQLRRLHNAGQHIHVIVTGTAGGGVFAALSAAATRVSMLSAARLQVLPAEAMAALGKAGAPDDGTVAAAIAAGAVDGRYDPEPPGG